MRFEILSGDEVVNTIVATLEFVEAHFPGAYRELPDEPVAVVLTKFEFLKRFTSDERKAINAAARVDPDVEDFKLLLDAATEVDLGHSDTVSGVQSLEAGGLLAAGRAAEILRR